MSIQLNTSLTSSAQTIVRPSEDHAVTVPTPAIVRARRAIIRFRAARITCRMIRELRAIHSQPVPGRMPLFTRLEALTARYEALGGDRSDLLR